MKKVSESEVVMTELILPQHTNQLGDVFGGTVMSWIDIAGAICSQRHSGQVCVTASIDELHFLRSIKLGMIANIKARITAVHNTSCEVQVLVTAENHQTGKKHLTTRAFLTFVSLDEYGRPSSMPKLIYSSEKEQQRAEQAVIRKKNRKELKERLKEEVKKNN